MDNIVLISISQDELKNLIREAVHQELNQKKEKELLNFKETRDLLGISTSTLNKLKSENKIPYKKCGKRVIFNRNEVLNSLKNSNYSKLQELKIDTN